jgi:hypothetical protein
VFNLTNRLNYDALIPSDRGPLGARHQSSGLLSFTYKFF